VGNSGEVSNECTRMEDGRLELDQQTGMMAVDATRQYETAGRSTRTADVWRRAGRWGEGERQGCARVSKWELEYVCGARSCCPAI
jgi:hypothetical protein